MANIEETKRRIYGEKHLQALLTAEHHNRPFSHLELRDQYIEAHKKAVEKAAYDAIPLIGLSPTPDRDSRGYDVDISLKGKFVTSIFVRYLPDIDRLRLALEAAFQFGFDSNHGPVA